MRRGEIWIAELEPRSGSEQRGTRPAIVMSHDGFNTVDAWRSIIVVPMTTSARQAARGPTAVQLSAAVTGLDRDGIALCHQLTTIDRGKLARRVGTVSGPALVAVERGVRAALDLQ